MGARPAVSVLVLAAALSACKPVAFAPQEADLMRTPPPLLPGDADAFWNDTRTGVYGQFTVGPGLFRRDAALCRSARITAIDTAARTSSDRMVLYCGGADGAYRLDPSLSCRAAGNGPALVCRTPEGDDVTLPPA